MRPRTDLLHSEPLLLGSVLAASGSVIAAPVAGRYLAPWTGEAFAIAACALGTASFVLAALQTFRPDRAKGDPS